MLRDGVVQQVDLGKVGDRYLTESAGVGLFANALALYRQGSNKNFLRGVYAATRRGLTFGAHEMHVVVDGTPHPSRMTLCEATNTEDHDRLNISLFALGGSKGLNLPLTMTAQDQSDQAWLQQAIKTNKQDISDAQKELEAVTDPEIKPLVALYLSAEYGHLSAAQTIMATMGKAAARR